jgi:hypothetical protein
VTPSAQRWFWRAGAIALLVAGIAASLAGPWNFIFGSVTGSAATSRDAPCLPGRAVEIMDSPHVAPAALANVRYNSDPPTSGPHFAFTIAPGVYAEPVSDGLTVHAMEHGHVIVHYARSTPAETLRQLERLAKRYPRDVILAPRPGLGSGVVATAWGRIDRLDTYDEARLRHFVEQLRNRYVHGWARGPDCPP